MRKIPGGCGQRPQFGEKISSFYPLKASMTLFFDRSKQTNIFSLKSQLTDPSYSDCPGPSSAVPKVSCFSYEGTPPADPNGAYGFFRNQGTSLAAPHVSGVTALVRANHPELTVEQVRQAIRSSARDSTNSDIVNDGRPIFVPYLRPGFDLFSGNGVVDATAALQVTSFPTVQIASPAIGGSFITTNAVPVTGTVSGVDVVSYRIFIFDSAGNGGVLAEGVAPITGTLATIQPPFADGATYTLMLEGKTAAGKTFSTYASFSTENPSDPVDASQPADLQQTLSSTDGKDIVWLQSRPAATGLYDVYLRDLAMDRTTQISNALNSFGRVGQPVVSPGWVVWSEIRPNGASSLRVYNRVTGMQSEMYISQQQPRSLSALRISGNLLVWQTTQGDPTEVMYQDLSSGAPAARISTSSEKQFNPAVSGQRVVWEDRSGSTPRIFLKDLSTGSAEVELQAPIFENPITVNGTLYDHIIIRQRPVIDNMLVAYECIMNDSNDTDICTFNLNTSTERALTSASSNQVAPEISGQSVVWLESHGAVGDVTAADLTGANPSIMFRLVRTSSGYFSHNRLVFERNNRIFTTPLSTPPLALMPIGDQTVDEGSTLRFPITADTSPGNQVVYLVKILPIGASFDPRATPTSASFTWTPAYGTVAAAQSTAVLQAEFEVRDGISRASQVVNITIRADRIAPSAPVSLRGSLVSGTSVSLTWGASTDNSAVAIYHVYRNGVDIAQTQSTTYLDSGLAANTAYIYAVTAFDRTGNRSLSSNKLPIKTTTFCTDSDRGQNIYVAGIADGRVNGFGTYFNDVCVTANGAACTTPTCAAVAEGYCAPTGVSNTLIPCPSGYSCQAGRCIATAVPTATATPYP